MIRTAITALALSAAVAVAAPASAAISISNTGITPTTWTVNSTGFAGAAVTVTPTLPANWVANNSQSSWVSINAQGVSSNSPATTNGNYTYATSFTGNVGDTLNFLYWADDVVLSMTLDGVTTALNNGTYTASTLGSFKVATNQLTHSLSFTVQNNGTPAASNPTGFRFQQVSAAVPEPATWGMMMIGFGMIGASARYRRRNTKVSFA